LVADGRSHLQGHGKRQENVFAAWIGKRDPAVKSPGEAVQRRWGKSMHMKKNLPEGKGGGRGASGNFDWGERGGKKH